MSSVLSDFLAKIVIALVPALKPWLLRTFSGVRFTYPVDRGSVPGSQIDATWKYRWLSRTTRLAVFHVIDDRFWPQGSPRDDEKNKILSKEVSIGDPVDRGRQYTLIIAAVSEDFRAAIRHYVHVNDTLEKSYGIDRCIPLVIPRNDMPPGLIVLDRVIFGVR
jgi:hypothetical protein